MFSYEIKSIKITDPLYPSLLKEITDPPPVLYYAGQWPDNNLFPLAVVGSRQADDYGQQAIDKIFSEDILNQSVIISGLALGIDAMAHKKARQTIAVLGTGLDEKSFYPKENWSLFKKIITDGNLVISEFSSGIGPKSQNFPRRNRIIAGLSRATLIVQAKVRSGALITARLALENGREVLAVPGSIINELSAGTNLLINQGAIPISNSQDLKEALGLD